MEKLASFFAGLFVLLQSFISTNVPLPLIPKSQSVKVNYIIDGDTIIIEGGKKVRYIGVDSSEITYLQKDTPIYECFAKEALDENKKLVLGKTVRLVKDVSDTDKYGRLLRYVYVDNIFVNDYLIKKGFVKTMIIKPDTKYAPLFYNSQNEAKLNKIGLWQFCQKNN